MAETRRMTIQNLSDGTRYVHTASGPRNIPRGGRIVDDFTSAEIASINTRGDLAATDGDTMAAAQPTGRPAAPAINFDGATKEELRAYLDASGASAPPSSATRAELYDAAVLIRDEAAAKAKESA